MAHFKFYLHLMRPANLLTAVADILAGSALATFYLLKGNYLDNIYSVLLLCTSSVCLYGGGIVFNDIFDVELDRTERPERLIPRGHISVNEAIKFGVFLFIAGIFTAFNCNRTAGIISIIITCAALTYNSWSKNKAVAGPINMGICRGLNLLLGMSIMPVAVFHLWYLGLISAGFIASVTLISSSEVYGGKRPILYIATALYSSVIIAVYLFISQGKTQYLPLIWLLLFALPIFLTLFRAIQKPNAINIRTAVKAGILALIILNGTWAAAAGQTYLSVFIIMLLPVSFLLGKHYAIT